MINISVKAKKKKYFKGSLITLLVGIATFSFFSFCSLFTPIEHSIAAAIQSVLITNKANNPVFIKDVDLAARQPFQWDKTVDFDPSQLGGSASFTVPAGKRLVIEFVSGDIFVTKGKIVTFGVNTTVNGTATAHHLLLTPQGGSGGYIESYLASQSLRLYADSNTTVTLGVNSTEGGDTKGFFTVSGYLVNLP
jgi:hypothetical protein